MRSNWPGPLQHELFDVNTVRAFAKGNAVPAAVGSEIEAIDDGWWSCVNATWEKGRKASEKIQAESTDFNRKLGRATGVTKSHEQKAVKDCAPHKKKLEATLVTFIEARGKERLALHARVQSRLASLR